MTIALRVIVPPHPLIFHWLTLLRTSTTPPAIYATGLEELGKWLTYEAIRDWIPTRVEEITTPQGKTQGTIVEASIPLIAIPILPTGVHLWNGARSVLPNADLCLEGVPSNIKNNEGIILFIDQIATGERIIKELKRLSMQNVEARRIRLITPLASSPGLKRIGEVIPDLTIHCACIDPELAPNGEIKPGIGNPVLRLNTRTTDPT
ncbi:uracil phosphoribosyltransferase [Prochlorococcus sp. MIT 1341]|uniref:uracil phosphoribosyltransferase n=1 Tax=Prochlorococcus sp. MIT 1341 TaxID=3096221 RepID=UPI002A762983|nr:uracil phosphoribosyltransferase [Prochlorococcus sp. MIT 1341]